MWWLSPYFALRNTFKPTTNYFINLVNVGMEYYLTPIIIRIKVSWKYIHQWRIFIHHKTLEEERERLTQYGVNNCFVSAT